jgi:hypothetical protein
MQDMPIGEFLSDFLDLESFRLHAESKIALREREKKLLARFKDINNAGYTEFDSYSNDVLEIARSYFFTVHPSLENEAVFEKATQFLTDWQAESSDDELSLPRIVSLIKRIELIHQRREGISEKEYAYSLSVFYQQLSVLFRFNAHKEPGDTNSSEIKLQTSFFLEQTITPLECCLHLIRLSARFRNDTTIVKAHKVYSDFKQDFESLELSSKNAVVSTIRNSNLVHLINGLCDWQFSGPAELREQARLVHHYLYTLLIKIDSCFSYNQSSLDKVLLVCKKWPSGISLDITAQMTQQLSRLLSVSFEDISYSTRMSRVVDKFVFCCDSNFNRSACIEVMLSLFTDSSWKCDFKSYVKEQNVNHLVKVFAGLLNVNFNTSASTLLYISELTEAPTFTNAQKAFALECGQQGKLMIEMLTAELSVRSINAEHEEVSNQDVIIELSTQNAVYTRLFNIYVEEPEFSNEKLYDLFEALEGL